MFAALIRSKQLANFLFTSFKKNMSGISFGANIFHKCQRQMMTVESLQSFVHENQITQRRLGALPIDWLKNIPKDEFASVTQKVDELLVDYSKNCTLDNASELNYNLAAALKKILKRDDIGIEYCDKGAFKMCQMLNVGKYKYALLTFFPKKNDIVISRHGSYTEPTQIFNAYKNLSHGRIVRPFMTRFCVSENEFGYILNSFVDEADKSRAKKILNPLRARFTKLVCSDSTRNKNMINGITVDIGGIKNNINSIKDNTVRNNIFVFIDRIKQNFEQVSRYDIEALAKYYITKEELQIVRNAENFLSKLMDEGINIYKTDIREHLKPLNKDEQKEVIRMIRRMRSVHNLKEKLKANGEYEYYKKILQRYDYYCSPSLAKELEIFDVNHFNKIS